MDQSEFRRMLHSGPSSASSKAGSASRGSLLAAVTKQKKIEASEPAFKPRKVKTKDSKYRDRALERRHGEGNDFAHVEALLEDFEKQTKDARSQAEIEEKRKYLGGDSEHSVLVKGLDFSLLEQNKAKAALVSDAFDEDSLEKAFQEATSSDKPKKRSKQELLQELKKKRASGDVEDGEGGEGRRSKSAEAEAKRLDELKQKGKFKPIGFKPIGKQEGTKKKAKDGVDGERKKKKRKLDAGNGGATNATPESNATGYGSQTLAAPAQPLDSVPEPADDDLDIFADAGEYEGLDIGEDDDEENDKEPRKSAMIEDEEEGELPHRQWVLVDDGGPILQRVDSEPPQPQHPASDRSPSHLRPETGAEIDVDEEEEQPMRLQPLSSSAFDIKELLEMDRAATSSRKNKKRKGKRNTDNDKGAAEGDGEAAKSKAAADRAERDYKRLKAYTDKKGSTK